MSQVLMVGAGELGTSLYTRLQKNADLTIERWDKMEGKVQGQKSLLELASWADVILLCIPSWGLRAAMHDIRPALNASLVVTFSKGIEKEEQLTAHELMQKLLPRSVAHAAIGGPMLAEEIEEGLLARGMVGGSRQAFETISGLWRDTNLSFDWTDDIQGVCMCGVLKNVYAVGLGIAAALKLGSNFNGWLIAQAVKEMEIVLPKLGGRAETGQSLAGLGDLIATGFSSYSTNRTCGLQLVDTGVCNMDSEGMVSVPFLLERLHQESLPPFLAAMKKILIERVHAKEVFAEMKLV
jgi:glycerol-3-phosphate dehydrogenase (NAD(P)+)